MKIIQIISQLGNGGAEKFVVELSNELSQNNDVVLVSFRAIEDWMYAPKKLSNKVKLLTLNKSDGFSPKIYWQLFKILRKEQPDVVHFHLDAVMKYVLPFSVILNKIKFIFTIHSHLVPSYQRIFSKIQSLLSWQKNIKYVCLATEIQHKFQQEYNKLKFDCIPNGIALMLPSPDNLVKVQKEIAEIKKTNNTLVLLLVGRIAKAKNYSLLLKVFKELYNKDIIALVIGDKKRATPEELLLIDKHKTNNVFFIGTRENIADYMACADAFVMTSTHEGMPITALEALSMQLPIIATPVGGLVDIVDEGKGGFLSQDVSEASFITAIQQFMALTPQEHKAMGIYNKQQYKQKYSIKSCAEKYMTAYQSK